MKKNKIPIPKQIADIKITVMSNGAVDYHGPLNDVLFIIDVLNKAQRAVLNHFIENRQKDASKIIVPHPVVPTNLKAVH